MAFPLEFIFRCFSALHICPDSGLVSTDRTCRAAHAVFKRRKNSKEGFLVGEQFKYMGLWPTEKTSSET